MGLFHLYLVTFPFILPNPITFLVFYNNLPKKEKEEEIGPLSAQGPLFSFIFACRGPYLTPTTTIRDLPSQIPENLFYVSFFSYFLSYCFGSQEKNTKPRVTLLVVCLSYFFVRLFLSVVYNVSLTLLGGFIYIIVYLDLAINPVDFVSFFFF